MSDVTPPKKSKQRFIIAVLFVLLLIAIGIPFYGNFFNRNSVSNLVTSEDVVEEGDNVLADTSSGETFSGVFPWNQSRPQGGYYLTNISCKRKIAGSYTVNATFYGTDDSRAFSTELTFTKKTESLSLKSISGFDAGSISDTRLGAVLLESDDSGVSCYTSIYHNHIKNTQPFSVKETLNSNIAYSVENMDAIIGDSATLYVQSLTNTNSQLSMRSFSLEGAREETPFTFSDGSDVKYINALGLVSIPLNNKVPTAYSLNISPVSGTEKINYVAYIEYKTTDDSEDKDYTHLRRYVHAIPSESPKTVKLPFNISSGWVSSLTCTSPKPTMIKATFKDEVGESFVTLFDNTVATKSLVKIPHLTEYIGKYPGTIELDLPSEDIACSSKVYYSSSSNAYTFTEADNVSFGAYFSAKDQKPGRDGKIYLYNHSDSPATLEYHQFREIEVPVPTEEPNSPEIMEGSAAATTNNVVTDYELVKSEDNLTVPAHGLLVMDMEDPIDDKLSSFLMLKELNLGEEDPLPLDHTFSTFAQYTGEDGKKVNLNNGEPEGPDPHEPEEDPNANVQECCPPGYDLYTGYEACREQAEESGEFSVSEFDGLSDEDKEKVTCCVKRECFCTALANSPCTSDADCCGGGCLKPGVANRTEWTDEEYDALPGNCSVPHCAYGKPCRKDKDCGEGLGLCNDGRCQAGGRGAIVDFKVAGPINMSKWMSVGDKYEEISFTRPKYVEDCDSCVKCHVCFYGDMAPDSLEPVTCDEKDCEVSDQVGKLSYYHKLYIALDCHTEDLPSRECLKIRRTIEKIKVQLNRPILEGMGECVRSRRTGKCEGKHQVGCSTPIGYNKYFERSLTEMIGEDLLTELKNILENLDEDEFDKNKKTLCDKYFPKFPSCPDWSYEIFLAQISSVYSNAQDVMLYNPSAEQEYMNELRKQCDLIDVEYSDHSNDSMWKRLLNQMEECNEICRVDSEACLVMQQCHSEEGEPFQKICEQLKTQASKRIGECLPQNILSASGYALSDDYGRTDVPKYTVIYDPIKDKCELKYQSCSDLVGEACKFSRFGGDRLNPKCMGDDGSVYTLKCKRLFAPDPDNPGFIFLASLFCWDNAYEWAQGCLGVWELNTN